MNNLESDSPKNPPPIIPGYTLKGLLGQGGMGEVWLARQDLLDRDVAIKVIRENYAHTPEYIARFQREAQALAQLKHPNIIAIYELGTTSGFYYQVMPYLSGGTLGERLPQLDTQETLRIISQIAKGLLYAHDHNMVHRDIKPANILFDMDDKPIIADFGTVKWLQPGLQITHTGLRLGSFMYMSPEQRQGGAVDQRSDIYALGLMFYEMLSGEQPSPYLDTVHPGQAVLEACASNRQWRVFKPLLQKMLAFNPNERYTTLKDFIVDLERVTLKIASHGKRTPLGLRWMGYVLGMSLVLFGGYGLFILVIQPHVLNPPESAIQTLRDCPHCPELVPMRGGHFTMGSPESEEGRNPVRERQHRVGVYDFYLGRYAVTVGEFRHFVQATDYQTEAERNMRESGCYAWNETQEGGSRWVWDAGYNWRNPGFHQGDDHPVVCVSWNDALAYMGWLSVETGQAYRLPTEAEWEYAARAGTTTARYWGNDPHQACQYANGADQTRSPNRDVGWNNRHECNDGYFFTAPVGHYRPNPWGLYDMLGNVWEWTCSVYVVDYSGEEQRCADANTSGNRVLRGGSWVNTPDSLRSAYRNGDSPDNRFSAQGFRVAR